MKIKMMIGALVLGLGLCSQSYANNLLDRMLGANGCGCETNCCTTSCCKPKLIKPKCCEPVVAPKCCVVVDPAPVCGCESSCGCETKCCREGILTKLHNRLKARRCCKPACPSTCGCEVAVAAPTCGCEVASHCGCETTSCCKAKRCRRSLLASLFPIRKCKTSCC
jgi:hypothetical protein